MELKSNLFLAKKESMFWFDVGYSTTFDTFDLQIWNSIPSKLHETVNNVLEKLCYSREDMENTSSVFKLRYFFCNVIDKKQF